MTKVGVSAEQLCRCGDVAMELGVEELWLEQTVTYDEERKEEMVEYVWRSFTDADDIGFASLAAASISDHAVDICLFFSIQ